MWLDEEEQNPAQPAPQQQPSNPAIGAGGGAGVVGTTGKVQGTPSTTTPTTTNQPQQFATAQQYLSANQPQGEALGSQVVGNLNQSLTNEKGAIDTAQNQALNDINSGTVNFNPALANEAATAPTKITSSPSDLQSFLGQYNASYTGPSSLETSTGYTGAANALTEAQGKAAETATPGGQQQILSDQFGVYGQGNKNLDQALLSQSSANPQLQDLTKQFGGVQDYLNAASANVSNAATQGQKTTQNTATATQNALANNLPNFQQNLAAKTSAAQTAATNQINQLNTDVSSGKLDQLSTDLQAAGVSPADVKSITDYLTQYQKEGLSPPNITTLIGNPNTQITQANVATPQDYANAAAWQQLTGVNYGPVLNQSNASEAGTGTLAQQGVNSQALENYLKTGVGANDQSLINSTPDLKTVLPDISNATQGAQMAQRYIDAFTRNGSPGYGSKNLQALPPQLQQLYQQAVTSIPNLITDAGKPQYAGAYNLMKTIMQYAMGQ